jgi:hypothetical protein
MDKTINSQGMNSTGHHLPNQCEFFSNIGCRDSAWYGYNGQWFCPTHWLQSNFIINLMESNLTKKD